jgi:hypothetical protein
MEASNIPKAQKSTTGSEQCEGYTVLYFDYQDVVHHEYAPLGQAVNNEYCQEVLHLLDAVSLLQAFFHLERNKNVTNTCYTTSLSDSNGHIWWCCEAAKNLACAWKSLLSLRSVSPPFHHYLPFEKI